MDITDVASQDDIYDLQNRITRLEDLFETVLPKLGGVKKYFVEKNRYNKLKAKKTQKYIQENLNYDEEKMGFIFNSEQEARDEIDKNENLFNWYPIIEEFWEFV